MSYLTKGDETIIGHSFRQNGGFHIATEYYLRGFVPLPYQYAYHQQNRMNTTLLAGIASGKTAISSASCAIDLLTIPYFKVLNTSVTAKQAELAFDMFMAWYDGNPKLEHHIEDVKLRPWPIITFKNHSVWEFRTSGTDARFIRGTEYDRIIFDECGLDFSGEIIKILRGRLRGTRPNGVSRLARLDAITSPTDAPWLRERYDRGVRGEEKYDPKQYISYKVRTRDNTRLTEEQIKAMESEYSDEMIAVEMDAEFPNYGVSRFPRKHIAACTSLVLNDIAYEALNPEIGTPKKGYVIEEHPRYGITKFELPLHPNGRYVLAGDPGQDGPPRRNAAVVGVIDVSISPHKLVYFHWIDGCGSYSPFVDSLDYATKKYKPVAKWIDTTGPQKMIQELIYEKFAIETDSFNFSNLKSGALNALSMAITSHEIVWPYIKGLDKQLSFYTDELDKKGEAQDIVMVLAMLAYGMRFEDEKNQGIQARDTASTFGRNYRRSIRGRR